MKCKVGAYTRVSRDSEYSESNSVDNQLSLIRRYCVTNNLDIVETYIDDGYSGTNFNRPGFCKMLNDARERKILDFYLLKYGSTMKKNDVDYAIVDGKIFFPLVICVLKRIGTKVITMHDLDDEGNPSHVYLNNTIGELSDKVITFKPNIETFLGITKEMCNDKYMGSIILINEFYLDDNEKLNELLEMINNAIEIVVKN